MRYISSFSKSPNKKLAARLNRAASVLCDKLSSVNIDNLTVTDYFKRYLSSHLSNLTSILQKYTYTLAWALPENIDNFENVRFLDYGGGTGLVALLSKQAGFGYVVYIDIAEESCEGAITLGKKLGLSANEYLLGDEETLLGGPKACFDSIASFDVLEHVYDLKKLFLGFHRACALSGVVFMGTDANPRNLRRKRSLMAKQRYFETKNRVKDKQRDSEKAFLDVRREIICKYAPDLPQDEVESLARGTRGMQLEKILIAVKRYRINGYYPVPEHLTNTCDPYTGNWCERLMDPVWVMEKMKECGFEAEIFPGFYPTRGNLLKRLGGPVLNFGVNIVTPLSLNLSPSYYVRGRPSVPSM